MSQTIAIPFYIVIGSKVDTKHGRLVYTKPSVRITRNKPAMDETEIAMYVDLNLPLSLFTKPTLSAKLSVPDTNAPPLVITPELTADIAEVLRDRLGIHMQVSAESAA